MLSYELLISEALRYDVLTRDHTIPALGRLSTGKELIRVMKRPRTFLGNFVILYRFSGSWLMWKVGNSYSTVVENVDGCICGLAVVCTMLSSSLYALRLHVSLLSHITDTSTLHEDSLYMTAVAHALISYNIFINLEPFPENRLNAVYILLPFYCVIMCPYYCHSLCIYSMENCFTFSPSVLWRCWLGGRKGIRPVKTWSGGVLAWLSVWSEVQTWCHCHSLSLASVKSRLVLPFWYRLTRVVPEKGPLNVCSYFVLQYHAIVKRLILLR